MPTPVIIDTDPGVDDIVALLYALASPEIEVVGIIVSFGNTDIESSFTNVLKLYTALKEHFELHPEDEKRFPNFRSVPFLLRGASGPIEGELHDAKYFHGRDGLGEIDTRYPDITFSSSVTENLLRILENDNDGQKSTSHVARTIEELSSLSIPPCSLTYIVLGPLTNLALLTMEAPKAIMEKIGRVVIMGGALDVPGNDSAVAEFNFFADPFAAREVLSGRTIPLNRILLAPLDVTTPHELNFGLYASAADPSFCFDSSSLNRSDPELARKRKEKSPLTYFTSAFFDRTREVMKRYGKDGMELHDIVAVWCAAMNPPQLEGRGPIPTLQEGWKATQRLFEVERKGEVTRGMCVVDRRYEAGDAMLALHAEYTQSSVLPSYSNSEADLGKKVHDFAAPVQVETEGMVAAHPSAGVACIVQTPGPEALVASMLTRIWGVRSEAITSSKEA